MTLFINKAWGYGDAKPDHYFLALNYRMTELQAAVARAQLQKVDNVVARRQSTADMMTSLIARPSGPRAANRRAGHDARLLEVPAHCRSQGYQGRLRRAW